MVEHSPKVLAGKEKGTRIITQGCILTCFVVKRENLWKLCVLSWAFSNGDLRQKGALRTGPTDCKGINTVDSQQCVCLFVCLFFKSIYGLVWKLWKHSRGNSHAFSVSLGSWTRRAHMARVSITSRAGLFLLSIGKKRTNMAAPWEA